MTNPAVPDREPRADIVLGHDVRGREVVNREYWQVGDDDGIGRWWTKVGVKDGEKWIPARPRPMDTSRWAAWYAEPQIVVLALHRGTKPLGPEGTAEERMAGSIRYTGYSEISRKWGEWMRTEVRGESVSLRYLYVALDIGFTPLEQTVPA